MTYIFITDFNTQMTFSSRHRCVVRLNLLPLQFAIESF